MRVLIHYKWYPYKKGRIWTQTYTHGKIHVKTKEEIKVMLLKAKECQRLPLNQNLREA